MTTADPVRDPRSTSLVWIDARDATIVRWSDDIAHFERLVSDVPAHHRSTGHVRHDPGIRHGGGGPAQTAEEPRRLEHLARFVAKVADRLSADDDVVILGPGTVRDHLARRVATAGHGRHGPVRIVREASPRRTDRQLLARLRHELGMESPRGRRRVAGVDATPPGHGLRPHALGHGHHVEGWEALANE